jgi:hypothetical protein
VAAVVINGAHKTILLLDGTLLQVIIVIASRRRLPLT